ncbi:MAG: SdrD B-like domain-containing protein [Caldilineaceae bacterium]
MNRIPNSPPPILRISVLAAFVLAIVLTVLPGQMSLAAPDAGTTCITLQPNASAGKDAFINQDKDNENKGSDSSLIVKTESGKLQRALLQFDLSSIPSTALVSSATLSLYVYDVKDGDATIHAHQVTRSWSESSVTWDYPWSNDGGDFGPSVDSEAFVKDDEGNWASWDITSLAMDWKSTPATNYGVLLESPVTNPKNETKFYSSDYTSNTSLRPKLQVCYTTDLAIAPDRTGGSNAGQTKTYTHNVLVGNLTNEIVNLSATSSQGWTVRIYSDGNSNGQVDGLDTIISQTPAIGPGVIYPIQVQIDVPASTAAGTSDTTTITATGQNSSKTDTATDTTLVGLPVVDGLLDPGYSFAGRTPSGADAPGNLYNFAGPSLCYYAFVVDRSFNDNVYAEESLAYPPDPTTYPTGNAYVAQDGWNKHTYKNLDGSDQASFNISYSGGSYSDLVMDYITQNSGNFKVAYFDGPISQAATSLVWNINNSGWGGTYAGQDADRRHSPPYNWNDAAGQYWEWHMIYEFAIPRSAMNNSCGTVTLAGAHNSPSKNNSSLGSIGDYIWLDTDGQGDQDEANAGIPGVRVYLRQNGTIVRTTETEPGTSGLYLFNNLAAGTYQVDVDESTLPPNSQLTTGNEPLTKVLSSGENFLNADFGYNNLIPQLAISKVASSPSVVKDDKITFTIRITNTGTTPVTVLPLEDYYDPSKLTYDTVVAGPAPTTVAGGTMKWTNVLVPPDTLVPGEWIEVAVRFTASNVTRTADKSDKILSGESGPAPAAPAADSFTLTALPRSSNAAATTACTVPFNNNIYLNTSDCKCVKPTSMTIRYLGAGPTTITIGGNGSGGPFNNINTGDTFTISVNGNEPTFTATGQAAQAIHTSCSAPLYPGWTSRPVGQDKTTQGGPFEVVSFSTNGTPFQLANPGSCTLGSIGNRVFIGTTVPDNGSEPGVGNVTVNLYGGSCPANPAKLTTASRLRTTTTTSGGVYTFGGLIPGEYCAAVDSGSIATLYTLSTASPLDAASNSNTVNTCDFGLQYAGHGTIGDRVFYDLNGDGLPDDDTNEPGLNGVVVNLLLNGQPFASKTTSGNGDYLFTNLPAGNFTVDVDDTTVPPGLGLTTGNDPKAVTLPTDTSSYLQADFGYRAICPSSSTPNFAVVDGAATSVGSPPRVSDTACVIIAAPQYTISKVLNGVSPVRSGETISFTIRITNTGTVTLTTVPLIDTYDTNYITFLSSTPPTEDKINDGTLNWTDLTPGNADLYPGQSLSVIVNFVGRVDTTQLPAQSPCTRFGYTCNVATASGVKYDPDGPGGVPEQGPLSPKSAWADVQIVVPTGVDVTNALASDEAGGVHVTWQTQNEASIIGFNLLRIGPDGERVLNGESLIPALASGQVTGRAYGYIDNSVVAGESYDYRLQIVRTDSDPADMPLGTVTARWHLFLAQLGR